MCSIGCCGCPVKSKKSYFTVVLYQFFYMISATNSHKIFFLFIELHATSRLPCRHIQKLPRNPGAEEKILIPAFNVKLFIKTEVPQ